MGERKNNNNEVSRNSIVIILIITRYRIFKIGKINVFGRLRSL